MVFLSNAKRRWTVYHSLQLSKSDLRKYGDEFAKHEPKWAFVLSNGMDQVLLMPNAGKIYFEWHTSNSSTHIIIELTEKQAMKMSQELWMYKQNHISEPKTMKTRIKPIGKALTWEASASTFYIKR
jgi:hypothetical protein